MIGGRTRIVGRDDRARRGGAGRKRRVAIAGSVALALLLLFALFITRWVRIRGLQSELLVIRDAQRTARFEQEALRARLALQDAPDAIETEARRRLGLVRPGEEKVIFVGEE